MEIIKSADNRKIKQLASLKNRKYRQKYGIFIVEEDHLILEAIRAGILQTLIIREDLPERYEFDEVIRVSDGVMKKLSDNISLNDYLGICRIREETINLEDDRMIILDGVQDPGNVGTIIRTAFSFGYRNIILSDKCVDLYNSKTVKATQGALFHANIVRKPISEALSFSKENGYEIIATALENSSPLKESVRPERFTLVFGSEGQGISSETFEMADQTIRIEMEGFDSLNVAVAAGICMYYFK